MKQVLFQISHNLGNVAYKKIYPVLLTSNRDKIKACEDTVYDFQVNVRWPIIGALIQD